MTGGRKEWLFPSVSGTFDDIELARLDPEDEDQRGILIRAEHADFSGHRDDADPDLHVVMHEIVANQIMDDNPPEVWHTAQRLIAAGYERHDVLHMLASVVSKQTWNILNDGEAFDPAAYLQALDELPESWHAMADMDDWEPPPDGTTLTHRLTAAEVTSGRLPFTPDFEPLDFMIGDDGMLSLVDGGMAEWDTEGDDAAGYLTGPTGWLHGIPAGELVGLRLSGTQIDVVPVETTADAALFRKPLLIALGELNDGDEFPVFISDLIPGAQHSFPDRAPLVLPPIRELLAACDFEIRDRKAAPRGTDWTHIDPRRGLSVLPGGLDYGGAEAMTAMVDLYRLTLEDKSGPEEWNAAPYGELADLIADPDLGPAFAVVATALSDATRFDHFIQLIEGDAPRRNRGGLRWLRAQVAIHRREHDEAEALLHEAIELQPDHVEALEDAAWYASDRGDARRALDLLRRVWEQDHDEKVDFRASVLARYARPTAAPAGRNDPCPCGSGKKYKQCCLNRIGLAPLPDRIRWMWEKLDWYLDQDDYEDEVERLLGNLGSRDPTHDLLVKALILFQDGAIEEFVTHRSALLPDDERKLFQLWYDVAPSVHEVVAVDRGKGATLRDLQTDEEVDIRERIGSTQMEVGDLLLTTVVPDGVSHQMVGGVLPIRLHIRDQLLELLEQDEDAETIVEFLAAAYGPPTMTTTEGEPMVFCEARYEIGDRNALDALDDVLRRGEGDTWDDMAEVNGQNVLRGSVAVEGSQLVVSANSQVRFDRLRQTVESAVPALALVTATTTPFGQRGSTARDDLAPDEPVDPETAAALDEYIRERERHWIDEEIPALGGRTPRQAAADPVGRKELEALLHDFDRMPPPPPGSAGFDTGRLRELLGLDQP